MALKPKEVEELLQNKFGFSRARSPREDHRWYELLLPGLPRIRTKVSRNRKEIGPQLEGMMAHQLHVRPAFYSRMMSCTKDRDDYYRQIRQDPYPPFNT